MTTAGNASLPMQSQVLEGLQALAEGTGRKRAVQKSRPRLLIGPHRAGCRLNKTRWSKPPVLRSFGRAYPGRPEQVKHVRADLRAVLNGCPIADETVLVASELAANAVTHSSSRQPGGRFILRGEVCPGDYVWLEVEDQGGMWAGHRPRDGRPHGLDIVQAIAGDRSWGIGGNATLGRVAWARLAWPAH